ncbi:MAG: O-antigen ligase family protein [Comamonadaceae bacterium]|nr:O-antigen ligase family protein [Comamonadaceae bacterium]
MWTTIEQRLGSAAQWALVAGFLLFPAFLALGNVALVLALLLALCAGGWRARWQQVRRTPLLWWALGLYGCVWLGVAYSPAPWGDVQIHLSKYGKLLALPLLWPLLQAEPWRQRCANAFAAGMVFILLSVYASVWWVLPWSATQTLGWGGDHTVAGDYITQNIMMCFFVLLALARGQAAGWHWLRAAWWLLAALAVLAITQLSQGRTGYLLLAVVLAVYVLVAWQGRGRWWALAAAVGALVLALWASPVVRERMALGWQEASNSTSMEITSIGGRVNFWRLTTQLALEKPLQGWGTGSYHSVWCQHVAREDWCHFGGWHPHNQYLFFWMENGLPGLLLFVLLLATPAWLARQAAPPDRPLLWGLSAILAVDSLVNAPLFSARESHFFILMLLLWGAQGNGYGGRRGAGV